MPGCRVHVWKNSVGGASCMNLKASDNGEAGVDVGSPGERVCDIGGRDSDLCISCWKCSYDFGVVYHTLSPSWRKVCKCWFWLSSGCGPLS